MPTSPSHEFVYQYLREKRDLAKADGGKFTWEDSQDALKEAWAIAKEKGLATTQNPHVPGHIEETKVQTLNPISRKGDMFRIREAEIKADALEDKYNDFLQKYGIDDGRTEKVYEALLTAQRNYGRIAYQNPKMPVGYYRDLPDTEAVVVRQYDRKLPKRLGVPSRETVYKRLKRTVAKLVGGEHDSLGQRALQFEVGKGGGPAERRRREEILKRAVKKNPLNSNVRVILMSALALAGLVFITRGTK